MQFDIGNHWFPSVARAALAESLINISPGMSYAVFAPGGAEAVDQHAVEALGPQRTLNRRRYSRDSSGIADQRRESLIYVRTADLLHL